MEKFITQRFFLSVNTSLQSPELQPQQENQHCASNAIPTHAGVCGSAASYKTPKQGGHKKVNRNRSKAFRDLCAAKTKLENVIQVGSLNKYKSTQQTVRSTIQCNPQEQHQ